MIPDRFKIIYEVMRKEIFEHFKTKRLLIVTIIFMVLFFIIAIWGGYIVGSANPDEAAYESGANNVLLMMLAFTGILQGIFAIVLSYDTIVGERTRRSLHLILSKPVDRSSIFIGKFLGAFLTIVIVYLIIGTIGYGLVIAMSGNIPSLLDVGRAYAAIGLVLFAIACWILFVMLFSTSFKTVISTILVAILFWFIILPLISFSGQLYYMATSLEKDEEPITIDFSTQVDERFGGINSTILTFQPHRLDVPILGVEFDVRHKNGTPVEQLQMSGGNILSLIPTYTLQPGEYTWTAMYEDEDYNLKIIGSGAFIIDKDFLPSIFVGNTEDDNYDDFIISIGSVNRNYSVTYDIFITSIEDNEIVEQELNYSGSFFLKKDLKEGDYRITVINNNITYLDTTFHSYGEKEPQMDFMMINEEQEIEYPTYVKITNALSPDNAAGVYRDVLSDESQPGMVLSVEEGIMALSIEFIILFLLGLFVFSRIELL